MTKRLAAGKGYILFQLGFSSGGGALLPAKVLAGLCLGRAPFEYDSIYPTFCPVVQDRNRLGRRVCRGCPAAMPNLRPGFDPRSRTPSQAGARCTSQLDSDPAWPLPPLRNDFHLSAAILSPLHALQCAGSLPGAVAAPCGRLLLGSGNAYASGS